MKAFILAAGRGTRLQPLTDRLPKILVPVLGVPILDRLPAGLRRHGVTELALNTHHLAQAVEQHLSDHAFGGGAPIRIFHEPQLLGTGGALVNSAAFWDQPLLLWNGDVLADLQVTALWNAHAALGAAATLAVSGRKAGSHLQVDADGWMCGIDSPRRGDRRVVGSPHGALRNRAYHGIAVLAPELLPLIARPGAFDLIDALLQAIAQGARVATFDAGAGVWGTTGSLPELQALEQGLREHPRVLDWFTP